MRVINNAVVNKRDNINTLVSGVHSLMLYIDFYIG